MIFRMVYHDVSIFRFGVCVAVLQIFRSIPFGSIYIKHTHTHNESIFRLLDTYNCLRPPPHCNLKQILFDTKAHIVFLCVCFCCQSTFFCLNFSLYLVCPFVFLTFIHWKCKWNMYSYHSCDNYSYDIKVSTKQIWIFSPIIIFLMWIIFCLRFYRIENCIIVRSFWHLNEAHEIHLTSSLFLFRSSSGIFDSMWIAWYILIVSIKTT